MAKQKQKPRNKGPVRRRVDPLLTFDALSVEGALIQPEMVARIATRDAAEQEEAAYGLDPGEKLRDVVQTKFPIAQSLHARFAGSDRGPQACRRFIYGLFAQVFEFTDLAACDPISADGRSFPIGHAALAGRVPIVFATYDAIDLADPAFGEEGRRRAPAQMLQECLNAEDAVLWGLVADGRRLRLYRDNAALTRPAYIEADLERLFDSEEPRIADFSSLWLLIHASRFGAPGTAPTDCPLERWRDAGRERGATARDALRGNVEAALVEFGQGFLEHPFNQELREQLAGGSLSRESYLEALLRLVYRLIFVFTSEDRGVLHIPLSDEPDEAERQSAARRIYKQGYGLDRLRSRAVKRHLLVDRHCDAFEGIKILFRSLAVGEKQLDLPGLGGLFGIAGTREFTDCILANSRFYKAIFHLAWLRTDAGLERVNWRDMETEELGSVYESLLELSPHLDGSITFRLIDTKGNKRKTTASYYTPDSLVQALLDETLDPLIEETVKGKRDEAAIEALLALRIIDPACGSGHFLLAAARRLATRLAQLASPGAPSPADFRHWLREAARRCLFGVDKNPMAVELAKVALWIETVEPGKPLSFLDAHIRCGDSLLGVYDLAALQNGIPDDAYTPLTGDSKPAATAWRKKNKAERDAKSQGELDFFAPPRALMEAARALEARPEDDLAEVQAKAKAFQALLGVEDRYRLETAADLYIAAFLLPKTTPPAKYADERSAYIPTSRDVFDLLSGQQPHGLLIGNAVDAAREAAAFHWPLEFPQVFADGGFDLAVGNPPWERIKLQEQEFFASRDPEIATAKNKAVRQKLIDRLAEAAEGTAPRRLFESFQQTKRTAEAASLFVRTSGEAGGRYPLTGVGDVNTYALFAELFSDIIASRGRSGLIVPLGIATDDSTKAFFGRTISERRLSSLLAFENEEFIFRQVHHAFRFALLTMRGSAGSADPEFAFFCRQVHQLADNRRRFILSSADIAVINPNTHTCPIFRTGFDAELTKKLYAQTPVLIDESKGKASNPWGIRVFTRIWHMAEDAEWFVSTSDLVERAENPDKPESLGVLGLFALAEAEGVCPLYEAKMIHHYDHRWASYEPDGQDADDLDHAAKADPNQRALPRYWVDRKEVENRLNIKGWNHGWLMGWRDITGVEKVRTVIAAVIPRTAVGHTTPLFFTEHNPRLASAFLANWSSLVLDYIARQKVGGTHLTYGFLKQFPMLSPTTYTPADLDFIVPRVLYLTYTTWDLESFAKDLAYDGEPFAWDPERRALVRAELDACYARLYGLTRDELRYILDPKAVKGEDWPSETFRVLKERELKTYQEYRTARLVLEAFDRMRSGELAA